MKRIVGLVISICILLIFGLQAFADTNDSPAREISPMYINIMSLSASLDINSSGTATGTAKITQGLSEGSCELIMNLQKLDSDNSWKTVGTWTKKGVMSCTNQQSKAVSKGTYRISVIGKVYDSNGNFIEEGMVNSIRKTY